ncbi:MAG: FAD-binding oxidoreductase [Streptosporangiales bacterium]
MEVTEVARTRMSWPGPAAPRVLTRAHRALLRRELGLTPRSPETPSPVRVRASALPPGALTRLAAAVGPAHVRTAAADRLAVAGGMSYLDLMRRRADAELPVPDAVVAPGSHEEVLAVLAACAEHDVAVVPYGGGTSVVGGVEPRAGGRVAVVTVDLARMDALVRLDEESQLATLQAGVTGPRVEELLGARGYTLGHFPQSWECSTVGGWVATRSAGQASTGVGRIDDLVAAVRVATPRGMLAVGHGPRSAAGPDLRALVTGSEGTLGVITEATLRVRPAPTTRRYEGWSFPGFGSGLRAFRRLVQEGVAPDVLRLSDAEETRVTLTLAGSAGVAVRAYQAARGHHGGCLAILGWEGTSAHAVRARRALAHAVVKDAGGMALGARVGASWVHGRYDAPYLRDALLDAGALAETLETASSWTDLGDLHAGVRRAVHDALAAQGTPPVVLTHVSHAYPTGASLYVTVIARRGDDAAAQWWPAKRAAMDAITAAGATITHHHGVGSDHAPWLEREVGALGVDALRAVKQAVDPRGIMNPGVLLASR